MIDLQIQLALARAYVDDNLVELCEEQMQFQNGTALMADMPHTQQLIELCAYAGHSSIRMAEGLIATAAMNRVVADYDKWIDHLQKSSQ
jgi:predicted O-methyltransferase YrrM